jgi:hypothetical protein
LDNNKNEQIKHDVWNDNDQSREEQVCKEASAIDILNTTPLFGSWAVKHYFVPIFTSGQRKQKDEWSLAIPEIFEFWINNFSFNDIVELEVS